MVRIEQSALGTVFICTHGAPKHSISGCRRTYLSKRDLQAHIAHRHSIKPPSSSAVDRGVLEEKLPSSTHHQSQQRVHKRCKGIKKERKTPCQTNTVVLSELRWMHACIQGQTGWRGSFCVLKPYFLQSTNTNAPQSAIVEQVRDEDCFLLCGDANAILDLRRRRTK